MNKEFVPYEESLVMKELGFDEECFGYYEAPKNQLVVNYTEDGESHDNRWYKAVQADKLVTAPLWQQAFRWFRDKHNISSSVEQVYRKGQDKTLYKFVLRNKEVILSYYLHNTYEEAQLACLQELIKIVKYE